MKKTYAYIIITSLILFNVLISSLGRFYKFQGVLSVPALNAPHAEIDEPDFASLFVRPRPPLTKAKK